MPGLTTVTVHGDRAADFERVFGGPTVRVTAPLPHLGRLPGFDQPQLVYLLDLAWAREEGHWDRLVEFICERFDQDRGFVEQTLQVIGMPILAADTSMMTTALL